MKKTYFAAKLREGGGFSAKSLKLAKNLENQRKTGTKAKKSATRFVRKNKHFRKNHYCLYSKMHKNLSRWRNNECIIYKKTPIKSSVLKIMNSVKMKQINKM